MKSAQRNTALASIANDSSFLVSPSAGAPELLDSAIEDAGKCLQVRGRKRVEERELALGLDIGTSCSKAVIGDAAAGKAFAVPFHSGDGIGRYTIPSMVFETAGEFSLQRGSIAHRDLKLSFSHGTQGADAQRRLTAFIALVIRRSRGWLFHQHSDIYCKTTIHWRLAIGLPSRQNFDTQLSRRFRIVGLAAWRVACGDGVVCRDTIDLELDRALQYHDDPRDVDIRVIPEIAAQIYGFVVSKGFDRKGNNIFLITDVGAGTVDASLFYVREIKGGRHNFSFYTSTVEPRGVINLHRHRCSWWKEALLAANASPTLIRKLDDSVLTSFHDLMVPSDFRKYFSGITVDESIAGQPDDEFFDTVARQVVVETFQRAVIDNQVPRHQLAGVPFYLCGGGSRMEFYGRLKDRLEESTRGISARSTPLTVPENLEADVVARDYDRLSVAYGLAWLDPGWVVETEPMGSLDSPSPPSWRDRFVDKDQI